MIFQLLAFKDEALLVRWDSWLLELDFGFYTPDCITSLNIEGDGCANEGLHKDLHSTASSAVVKTPIMPATVASTTTAGGWVRMVRYNLIGDPKSVNTVF